MSNKLTRKGLAFGGMVSLIASVFAGAPAAQATDRPEIILKPLTGTTFNSILESGITLNAELNYLNEDVEELEEDLVFRVVNLGAKDIQVEYKVDSSWYYDDTSVTGVVNTRVERSTAIPSAGIIWPDVYTEDGNSLSENHVYSHQSANTSTTAKYVYVSGAANEDLDDSTDGDWDYYNLGQAEDSGTAAENNLKINTLENTGNVTLQVLAWLDSNRNGVVDPFEPRSIEETVVLYGPGNYTATTTMFETTRSATDLKARVVYSNNINASMVLGKTVIKFYKDGTVFTPSAGPSYSFDSVRNAVAAAGTLTGLDAAGGAGVYHARTFYQPTNSASQYQVGPQSVALDLRDGINATVTGAVTTVSATADVRMPSTDTLALRSGTKAATLSVQAVGSDGVALRAAGIEVRAVVDGLVVDAGSTISVTGAAGTITSDEDSVTAIAFTNASGQVSFTINNTVGKKDDQVRVTVTVKNSAGRYVNTGTGTNSAVTATWADAALTTFTSSVAVVSGANIANLEFSALDQWRQGIDTTSVGRLSVEAVAVIAGLERPLVFRQQSNTAAGKVSFSFANFAASGQSEILRARLIQGQSVVVSPAPVEVTVFNTLETGSITLANVFENRVAYVDYVTGDLDNAADAKAASDAGVSANGTSLAAATNKVTLSGTVLNINNQGQPGAPVTISATGALFFDAATKVLAKDSITVTANNLGFFTVDVVSQKVNAAGQTVTITSGGKTATTLLRTYLPADIAAGNLKFSWTLPANVVMNKTYSVSVKLTDVWGNPVRTADTSSNPSVLFEGNGSLQVNGVASVRRNTNASGEATVFVRSFTDAFGPGSLSATLTNAFAYHTGALNGAGESITSAAVGVNTTPTNALGTSWNEATWSNALTTVIDVLEREPAGTGRVNVGSFNGKLVVYAADLAGARISWKVGGNWGTAIAQGNTLNRFDRPTPRRGVTVSVEIYVNGVKQLTKSVVTR